MAITKKESAEYDSVTNKWVRFDEPRKVVTHVGRVLEVYHDNFRAMSDIWTLATFARVIRDDGSLENVLVNANFELDTSGGFAEVDADAYARALHHCWKVLEEAKAEQAREQEMLRRQREENNRPVKGKKMRVVRGRKVPIGFEGTVAFIHSNGGVLLKPDHCWQDRNVQGVWVDPRNLEAR